MSRYAEKNTCISGIGQSDIFRKPSVLPFELAVRACEAAIADAGIEPSDVTGVFHGTTVAQTPIGSRWM